MYIAIEGIKGAGKTTLISKVLPHVRLMFPQMASFSITAPMCGCHELERQQVYDPDIRNDDRYLEYLFLSRAYFNQLSIPAGSQFILGDRCIATACVSRWNKWNDPYYTIKKVNEQYAGIRKPNVIIWMKTGVMQALQNINHRPSNGLGINHEGAEALEEANNVYHELFRGRVYQKKINRTQVIEMINNSNPEEVKKEILSILKFYSK